MSKFQISRTSAIHKSTFHENLQISISLFLSITKGVLSGLCNNNDSSICWMLHGCVSCASLVTVKKPNEFGDGRLSSGRDPLGGGKTQMLHRQTCLKFSTLFQ